MKKLFCLIYFSTFAISFGQAYALYTHYFRNDFPNGKIKVNGVQYDVPSDPKFDGGPLGVWKRWIAPDGTQNATALSSQYTNGAHYFSNWEENGAYTTSNLTYSFPSFYNQVYTIEHVAKYTSTFTVTVVGSPYGILVIDGIQYTGSKSKQITEPNVVVASAHNYENNGISFIFTKWDDGSTTQYYRNLGTNINKTYTAKFEGEPNNNYRNQYFNPKVVGQPIKVYWSQHPSTNVTQYKIYRKPKFGSETCIGTVSRTGDASYTYNFTDPDMVHTNSSSSYDLYYYDVRAYYSPDGNYSDYDFKAVYAEMGGPIADDSPNEERMQIAEKTYEYGISNYPNPYNPTTTINYQIKEMGNVNITVFDALGRTVKVLVNDIKQPGEYNILFDGSNLSNGVYYYRMQAGNFVETKKMIMMK